MQHSVSLPQSVVRWYSLCTTVHKLVLSRLPRRRPVIIPLVVHCIPVQSVSLSVHVFSLTWAYYQSQHQSVSHWAGKVQLCNISSSVAAKATVASSPSGRGRCCAPGECKLHYNYIIVHTCAFTRWMWPVPNMWSGVKLANVHTLYNTLEDFVKSANFNNHSKRN